MNEMDFGVPEVSENSFDALHDSLLKGLQIGKDAAGDTLELRFETGAGVALSLTILQVLALRFDRFLSGNIVLDVEENSGSSLTQEELEAVYYDGGSMAPEEYMLLREKFTNVSVLRLSTSYGCEGLVITRAKDLERLLIQLP